MAAPMLWTLAPDEVLRTLGTTQAGLSSAEAARRLSTAGPNDVRATRELTLADLVWRQVRSPLLLLLLVAATVSMLTGAWTDAGMVLVILVASTALGVSREYRAHREAASLQARLLVRAVALRDGLAVEVPARSIVPGDVVRLAAGSLVPADGVVLEATDFFVSEAALTGESVPVPKTPADGPLDPGLGLAERQSCVYLGTNVRSGTASCVVTATGLATEYGAIAHELAHRVPPTEFSRGLDAFGSLLARVMLVMVYLVYVAHTLLGRPPADTLLFSMALAVGLSPELLPAILSVSLARGARVLAQRGVLVRRLEAIENLGSMDVLCTDKTGTLTEGVLTLEGAYDASGVASDGVLRLGAQNAALETGISSPLDEAITRACPVDTVAVRKLGEVPFDFIRKRVTVGVDAGDGAHLVTKGAVPQVLDVCTRLDDGRTLGPADRDALLRRFETWTARGIRVLAVATRTLAAGDAISRDDEQQLTFVGFLTFLDQPKAGAAQAVSSLAALGVSVKMITGDSHLVALHVARLVGLRTGRVITGRELGLLGDEALAARAGRIDVFAEVDPHQKERIILALKRRHHVVGFLGDGVNDAPAMHAADTSLSVEGAVDVAREAADFVLLERSLDVIRSGIEEGRTIFANTMKYILITMSANLGNMASMAVASVWLPFLPLTAGQILLNNLLSDVPAMGLADDRVERSLVARPRRWNLRVTMRTMAAFGAVSSVFDLGTFWMLIGSFGAGVALFQTGWFVESLLTELGVVFVLRTRGPFYRSRPGSLLLALTLSVAAVALALPYLPVGAWLGFVPLHPPLLLALLTMTTAYMAITEWQKRWLWRRS